MVKVGLTTPQLRLPIGDDGVGIGRGDGGGGVGNGMVEVGLDVGMAKVGLAMAQLRLTVDKDGGGDMGMVEVGMTMPQLKSSIGKDRFGTGVWMWQWRRSGLTLMQPRLELMMALRIGTSCDHLGTKSWL